MLQRIQQQLLRCHFTRRNEREIIYDEFNVISSNPPISADQPTSFNETCVLHPPIELSEKRTSASQANRVRFNSNTLHREMIQLVALSNSESHPDGAAVTVGHFDQSQQELSDKMVGYWTNFAKTGNPNGVRLQEWAPYTQQIGITINFVPGAIKMEKE